MDSLFLLMIVLFIGVILLALHRNRNYLYNKGPLFYNPIIGWMWKANKKVPYYFIVSIISFLTILICVEIDLRKVDYADPANIVIIAIIVFIIAPFYWLLWPTKKNNEDS